MSERGLVIVMMVLTLAACGPNTGVQQATAVADVVRETALAPPPTQAPRTAPPVTPSPQPTPTLTVTLPPPTLTLDLPEGFNKLPEPRYPLERSPNFGPFTLSVADGFTNTRTGESVFVGVGPLADVTEADGIIEAGTYADWLFTEVAQREALGATFGDTSRAERLYLGREATFLTSDVVAFRIEEMLVVVAVSYPTGITPLVDVLTLAAAVEGQLP